MVHGSIEPGERPEDAARREVQEETGLTVERLYSITVNPFYVQSRGTIQVAVVFAAIVDSNTPITLGEEHDTATWRTPAAAAKNFAWPRSREAMWMALDILATGDAGPREDVLRIT
jgi:8-oxo-dGTP pyrophosphatase MutT (NUDIX family)